MKIKDKCSNCYYYGVNKEDTNKGTCLRHAPFPVVIDVPGGLLGNTTQQVFFLPPGINDDYWCGDHKVNIIA